ncbi:LOW QUALITY PROTEIN: uncharacterized protein LOC110176444 [Drosophila serrata]|uniref:LOW QUALITY PROTEIN: uncharacterized protein LOC110176444 n=1 Tax=Drosophila serrata TaxID=7274 RepID=UPI000A1CF8F2|nr:LOW QUALITY PROTEIN: uncharacterized protein LOC110176444 [Drosophila serrata]
MSCQQVSRFQAATLAKSTPASRRIATAAAAAAATLTPVESIAAAKTTSEDTDPYAFTETVAVAPPILFNAQKSRTRLSDSSSRSSSNKRQSATAAAASRKANLVLQLNATAAAATAKAQASLATNTTTTTTNFHHVTQSQRQSALSPVLQLQLPLQSLQSQSQASPKRATNVCIVRPQQQQQEKEKESCQATVAPPPPPLYSHTPSLWQTPLLLDNGQKQTQPQPKQQKQSQQLQQKPSQPLQQNKQQQKQIVQQQQHQKQQLLHQQHLQQQQKQQQQLLLQQQQLTLQQQQSIAVSLVSPPTSPASLTSPTLPPATGAVTAMVAPISVSPKGGLPLPPSKFHHTTLAQHLQKVECLKKKKSLPLASQNNNNNIKMLNNNNMVESLNKPVLAQGSNYNQTQPPPLTVFNSSTVATPPPPIAASPQKHSSGNNGDNTGDLNEIPVNVIFRMPPVAGASAAQATDGATGIKMVTPLTPPTPPELSAPPLLAHMHPPTPTACVPALTVPSNKGLNVVSPPAVPSSEIVFSSPPSALQAPSLTTTPAPAAAKKNEQMSSKAAAKRQASTTPRRGNNNNIAAKKLPTTAAMPPPPPQEPVATSPSPVSIKSEPSAHRQRRRKPSSNRCCSVTLSENETFLPDSPYCLQQHWLHSSSSRDLSLEMPLSPSNRREERIAMRKGQLRRQALQLLSTRSLQDMPMRAARQRLQCVQNLLLKYQDHAGQQQGIGIGNRCLVANCKLPTLSMAAHCDRHIVNNSTQQLFQPCVAWRMDGTACQAPVFDVLHTLALCTVHSHLRAGLDAARPPPKHAAPVSGAVTMCVPVKQRKRKANPNPVARPQKRGRKPAAGEQPITGSINSGAVMSNLPLIPTAGMGMQRKNSTTSLESIASNSHSSAASHSQVLPYTPAPQTMPQLSIPPALAPLSGDYQSKLQQQPQQQPLLVPKLETGELPLFTDHQQQQHLDIKAEEISQIVAQLAAAGGDLHQNNNNNSSNHNHNTNNNSVHFNNNNNNISYSNNNNQHSFPSFNTAFGNAMGQPIVTTTPVTATITHNGSAVTPAPAILANTADLLGQDMFGICENSSAYASSEDTGLGGISESELMAGAHDADDIALNGAHLLEEHDLVNVFDTLPDDAFNELFQSVQQAECEAMDRALEIADKNLKCLQQTIGGSADSADFLNDFLDVSDDLLADAVMHSPNTSGIDAATLFVDSSSGGGNSSSNGASTDIRGLVLQT